MRPVRAVFSRLIFDSLRRRETTRLERRDPTIFDTVARFQKKRSVRPTCRPSKEHWLNYDLAKLQFNSFANVIMAVILNFLSIIWKCCSLSPSERVEH